jgi:flagellar M-ring protein FliF
MIAAVELVVQNFKRVWGNLLRLGARRLMALGVVGVAVITATLVAGYQLSRPQQEVLYTGLDKSDVARMGSVLREAGVPFDLSADGATINVRYGSSPQARAMLAEKGLPSGSSSGYELFDKLGSLGLTSFMQEVTRVRAVEGELARTIQLIRGVRAARVHIVLADEGSFRRARQPPSASVIVRTDGSGDARYASAIRHLVSAAVPGMKSDQVTVINSDGTLLATQDDASDISSGKARTLEKSVSSEIQDNIRRTLTPYLGLKNFQISVAVRLNTDKKQTNETIFNPDSRVERSVRVTRENQTAQNAAQQSAVSVERNVPQDATRPAPAKQSNEETQKREELTNYEISTKTVQTVKSGHAIEALSIALLLNRASIVAQLGEKATPDAINAQLAEIEALVASAAGLRKDRGDFIKVSAVDFSEAARDIDTAPSAGIGEQILQQSGAIVNAAAMLLITALVVFFVVRPITRALLREPEASAVEAKDDFIAIKTAPMNEPRIAMMPHDDNLIADISSKPLGVTQQRLEQIVQYDEERAAAVMRQWMRRDEAA